MCVPHPHFEFWKTVNGTWNSEIVVFFAHFPVLTIRFIFWLVLIGLNSFLEIFELSIEIDSKKAQQKLQTTANNGSMTNSFYRLSRLVQHNLGCYWWNALVASRPIYDACSRSVWWRRATTFCSSGWRAWWWWACSWPASCLFRRSSCTASFATARVGKCQNPSATSSTRSTSSAAPPFRHEETCFV